MTITGLVPPLALRLAAGRGGAPRTTCPAWRCSWSAAPSAARERPRPDRPGARLHAAAGVRDGRGPGQLHPPGRPRRDRARAPRAGRSRPTTRSVSSTTGRPRRCRRRARSAHLLTRGPYTIRGYFRAAEHNASRLHRGRLLPHRRPGPPAPPTGYLVVEGRAKDQINRGGEKIAAEEVENHLLAHPAVHDAAVVAVPDAYLGERTLRLRGRRGPAPSRRRRPRCAGSCASAGWPRTRCPTWSRRRRLPGDRRRQDQPARAARGAARRTAQPERLTRPMALPTHRPLRAARRGRPARPARVGWTPDPARAVLLVHDMQRYFLAAFTAGDRRSPRRRPTSRGLRGGLPGVGIPVFYTAQPGGQDRRGPRPAQPTSGAPGIGAVTTPTRARPTSSTRWRPRPGDTVLTKWRYSAFVAQHRWPTGCRPGPRPAHRHRRLRAHRLPDDRLRRVHARHRSAFVVADAVADFSRRHHDQACEYVAQRCGVVTTTGAVLDAVSAVPAGVAG